MSALGEKRTSRSFRPMSALPPKADIRHGDRHFRFVPKADSGAAAIPSHQLICTSKTQHCEVTAWAVTKPPVPISLAGIDAGYWRLNGEAARRCIEIFAAIR
jgi:hypothetical protein